MKKLLALAALLVFAGSASATTRRILAPMDWWPVVSPDGTRVAFTRVYPNRMQLELLDLRTHRVTPVGQSGGRLSPSWSPDGTRLAYTSGGVLQTVAATGRDRRRYLAPAKAYAPAWRPGGDDLAYVTTHGAQNTDVWVAGQLWARDAIGSPAWSPDGAELAFQRDDGIWVTTGPGAERRLVPVANPGAPAWSPDGKQLAYVHGDELDVVAADGSGAPRRLASNLRSPGTPSWSPDGARVAVSRAGGVWVANMAGGGYPVDAASRTFGAGAAWLGTALVVSASRPACPGHLALREVLATGKSRTLTGSCLVEGTSRADAIEGTPLWGDVILAGAGNDLIHANDGHTDRVDCGPGRDIVWADRSDRLVRCEIVHR